MAEKSITFIIINTNKRIAMKAFTSLVLLSLFAFSVLAADNITTRASYPQPRMTAEDTRVYPIVVVKTTDEMNNVISLGPITQNSWYYATPIASPIVDTSAVVLKGGVASTIHYVSNVSITNPSGTGSIVTIKDGSTVMWSGYLGASGQGLSQAFNPPLKATSSASINFVVNSTASNVHVSAQGFSR